MTTKDDKRIDAIALVLSIISLIVSGFSIYLTEYKKAEVETTIGQKALVNAKPRIGLLCVFTNMGSRQKVITSAKLIWEGRITFNLELASSSLEQWEFDQNGNVKIAEPTKYTALVTPIAIKGRDQSTAIFWFHYTKPTVDPNSEFKFTAGKHRCVLKVFSRSEIVSVTQFEIELTAEDLKILENPTTETGVKTGGQLTQSDLLSF